MKRPGHSAEPPVGLCGGGFQAAICLLVPFQVIQANTVCPNLPAASPLRRKKLASKVGTALERKLHGQLDAAGPPAAEERIADADVAGGHNGIPPTAYFTVAIYEESAPASRICRTRRRIGNKRWKERIGEVGV